MKDTVASTYVNCNIILVERGRPAEGESNQSLQVVRAPKDSGALCSGFGMRVVAERAAMKAQSYGSAHRKADYLPHGDLGRRGKTVDREQEQGFDARLVSAGCPYETASQDKLTMSS